LLRDDGYTQEVHPAEFITPIQEMTAIHRKALDRCRGKVLDVGAGARPHAIELQNRGLKICAIDKLPIAVLIMKSRGLLDVRQGDFLDLREDLFVIVLFSGNVIDLVGTQRGLTKLLHKFDNFVSTGVRIILESWDFRRSKARINQLYYSKAQDKPKYAGETYFRFCYREISSEFIPWLFIDPEEICSLASSSGLNCDLIASDESGEFLAELFRV
jgi:hypothetical protein